LHKAYPETKPEKKDKRPLNSYMLYSKKIRSAMKKQNPGTKTGELSKLIANKWKTLDDKEKKPYEEAAKTAAEAYKLKNNKKATAKKNQKLTAKEAELLANQRILALKSKNK
jgi:hypothetical protein